MRFWILCPTLSIYQRYVTILNVYPICLTVVEINILTMSIIMSIIMTMNIYITRENEEWLRKQSSMSGVINRLLNEARGGSSQSVGSRLTDKEMLSNLKRTFGGTTVQPPSPVEKELLDSLPRDLPITTANKIKSNGLCKKHGTPLTPTGQCLQKGH